MGNLLRINESIYKSGWWFEIFHVSFHRTWGWWPISGALKSQSKHGFVRLLSSRISSWDDIAQNSKREEAKVVGVFVTKHIQWIADKKSALSRFDPVVDSRLVSRCLPPIPLKKQDFNRLPVYHLFAMVSYPCCMYLHPKLICLCICASSEESWTEWPMTHLPIWVNTKHSELAFHIPTSWCWVLFVGLYQLKGVNWHMRNPDEHPLVYLDALHGGDGLQFIWPCLTHSGWFSLKPGRMLIHL